MGRKVHGDGSVLIWGTSGAVFVSRLAPGVLYVIGIGDFDGPFEDGPMLDFDRELDAHGSLHLFLDVRQVRRGSRKSRGPWKEWAARNSTQHKSYVLVKSSLLHMAISVIAMASGTTTQSYADELVFLSEVKRRAPSIAALPTVPAWVSSFLQSSQAPRAPEETQ